MTLSLTWNSIALFSEVYELLGLNMHMVLAIIAYITASQNGQDN